MTLYYFDTSAVVRAYFADEDDHDRMAAMLFDGNHPVVTSELTRVEFTSAAAAAARAYRVGDVGLVLDRFDLDCGDEGVMSMLRLHPARVLPLARRLVLDHPLRTPDAIHLAVLLTTATDLAAGEPVALVTFDRHQAAAAQAIGVALAPDQVPPVADGPGSTSMA